MLNPNERLKPKINLNYKYLTFFFGAGFVLMLISKFPNESSTHQSNNQTVQSEIVESTLNTNDETYDLSYDYFKMIMTETKRRECLGKPGKELKVYSDGGSPTIGYGCHISNLSKDWKKIIKSQGGQITEPQARELMYNHFEQLDVCIKKDLPNLSVAQYWAVKSLSYNYGWGNVKKSKLYSLIKSKDTSNRIKKEWMKTWANTDNHRRSRSLELSLWLGDNEEANRIYMLAYSDLEKRGDFKYYKK